MLLDHVGIFLFPQIPILRILGRISFPIFSFMVAEGCRYTHNKMRYFITIFGLGIIFQVFYVLFSKTLELNVFITFSLSIILVYSLQFFQKTVYDGTFYKKCYSAFIFLIVVVGVFFLNKVFKIHYSFAGCILPVFASCFYSSTNKETPKIIKTMDSIPFRVVFFAVGLLFVVLTYKGIQIYSLFSIPLLLLYSGNRGKCKMKYFYYVFFPAHIVILQILAQILL